MLDEPTNHLDMHSVELLAEALTKYEGSLILVSHDRYFVSKTANKIWEIVDHEIKEFKGSYKEYLDWKERMAKQAKLEDKKSTSSPKKEEVFEKKVEPIEVKPIAKPRFDNTELKKIQNKFKKSEETIEELKRKKTSLELELGAPDSYKDAVKFAKIEKDYAEVGAQLKNEEANYEQLFDQIMEMEK
jgi:ATP-binding cassette subfamily F protein 3